MAIDEMNEGLLLLIEHNTLRLQKARFQRLHLSPFQSL